MEQFRTIYTKNIFHLGDCIYSLIMLKNIQDYIEKNNILVYFYCEDQYICQVRDFNTSSNVTIDSLGNIPPGIDPVDLWIGSHTHDYNFFMAGERDDYTAYDVFFCKYYNNILKKLDIPVVINQFTYSDSDLVDRCKNINERTNGKYMDIDFLINNSAPRSGQLDYNFQEWEEFIIELSKKYNVVTTQKVPNIKCTYDDNLTVKDIAAVALNAKQIIAIESGVMSGLYNTYITEDSSKKVYNLSRYHVHRCSFSNFIWYSTLNEIRFLLE